MIQIYHNNRCSKSRSALSLLKESGKEFEVINYLEIKPSFQELQTIINKLGTKPFDLIRKTEQVFIDNYKGKTLTDEEWINAMVSYPILIERPIVVAGTMAVIARPIEKLEEMIKTL